MKAAALCQMSNEYEPGHRFAADEGVDEYVCLRCGAFLDEDGVIHPATVAEEAGRAPRPPETFLAELGITLKTKRTPRAARGLANREGATDSRASGRGPLPSGYEGSPFSPTPAELFPLINAMLLRGTSKKKKGKRP